jgi:hypothetical protein
MLHLLWRVDARYPSRRFFRYAQRNQYLLEHLVSTERLYLVLNLGLELGEDVAGVVKRPRAMPEINDGVCFE